jgi:hypothetical protein
MATNTPTGFEPAVELHPREDRRERARTVASFAEYLAEDVAQNPEHALDAMAALAEWCEGDPDLFAQARANVLRDMAVAQADATDVAAMRREAADLLERAARAS